VEVFVDDDAGYRAWIYANPSGFVVNALRGGSIGDPILHRAMCETITPTPDTPWTTGDYLKACAVRRFELDEWAREHGKRLTPCVFCDP
jgi:hypothetical protein